MLKKKLFKNFNEANRNTWIKKTLTSLPKGLRILDAGAGELRYKEDCKHLTYISQDFCQYEGTGNGQGLQTGKWDTSRIDIVCDINNIPEPDNSFDVILCSEVFEHVPDPVMVLKEFSRLLKPGGKLILTAPFSSHVHFAPYHYCTGFSKYWYEYHLKAQGFNINELTPNGDWFDFFRQELARLGGTSKKYSEKLWPIAYLISFIGLLYFKLRGEKAPKSHDLCCFGWHCVATRNN